MILICKRLSKSGDIANHDLSISTPRCLQVLQSCVVVVLNGDTTTDTVTPHSEALVISLPEFPHELLAENWTNIRQFSGKLNTAAYSVRCILAAMIYMQVHKMGDMRAHEIHVQAEKKTHRIGSCFQTPVW